MTQGTAKIWFYYTGAFALVFAFGIIFGFSNAHAAPSAFILELLIILFGFLWLTADNAALKSKGQQQWERVNVHLIGLVANGLLAAYILIR